MDRIAYHQQVFIYMQYLLCLFILLVISCADTPTPSDNTTAEPAPIIDDVSLEQLDKETVISVLRNYNREEEESIYPYLCSVLEE